VGQKIYFSVQAPENHPVLASSRIRACGVLAPLARRPNPGFDSYLANSGAAFKFTRGRWLAEERGATRYRIFCANASARFERILGLGLDDRPDLRSVHVAMLLGTMAELSAEQRKLFMNSGTMHLFAISGLHIAVIWAVLAALLAAARIPRVPAIVAGLVLLLLYVEITGGAPSAMRSWMMIAFVLAGQALRWARNPLAGIAGSALLAIWWNPWQLFGLGFQMSYAIVAALLLYGLPLDELWQRRWRPWRDLPPGNLGWWRTGFVEAGRAGISAVALAVAATLISVPMTLANFGLLTPGSMLVNLVCIPASSLSIIAGIGSIIAGLAGLAPLSVLLNHASALIILSMERGLDLAMQVPGMYWPAQFKVEWMGDALLVVLLALMLAGYALRWRRNVGGMWPPVVVVLLALAVLVHHGPPEQPAAAHLPDAIPPATSANR
jgi:competence protein ComEC